MVPSRGIGEKEMKLATIKNGTRDGSLAVVTADLSNCVSVSEIAPTLQSALDNWDKCEAVLKDRSDKLNADPSIGVSFNQAEAMSPLPRAYQWADGSAYVNHVELVRKARGAEMPKEFWADPLMYQGGSDTFLSPYDPIEFPAEAVPTWGIDFEGEVAVIVDDCEMGISPKQALKKIRLVMIVNDVSLRGLIPAELGKGFGFFQSKPSSAFSPVAVTPDELGDAWKDGKLSLPLLVNYNGDPFGKANAGVDMTFDFGQLIAHAAKSRPLSAGSIIGSGTVSNKEASGSPGRPISDGGIGYSCIAEIRMIETINNGKPETPFMAFGDTIEIKMGDGNGRSIFGSIHQKVDQL